MQGFPSPDDHRHLDPTIILREQKTKRGGVAVKEDKRADMAMMMQRKRKGHSRTHERRKEVSFFIGRNDYTVSTGCGVVEKLSIIETEVG